MKEIARADWDAVANPDGVPYNPFVAHDFLWSLEESGSATRRTGWAAHHIVCNDAGGRAAAILPCYLKSHSMGEYVFDHGWAEAYERAGGRYYPKLQASIPFTPATGRRLLVKPGDDIESRQRLLAAAGSTLAEKLGISSLNVTFAPAAEWELLGRLGFLQRTDHQYHFVNEGYRDFDDFLSALASRHRKAIRRERRDAVTDGITIECLTGAELTEAAWDAFFEFYMDTGSRKWGRPYLNRRFFSLVGERMADRILLFLARRNGRPIAGALNFIGSDTLFGRYWGATEHQPFLHFELCYYQAIEWGIVHGKKIVEAGAQGEHKVARGYRPTTTYSAHWIRDPAFRKAVADYLKVERRQVEHDNAELAEYLPFRHEDGGLE
ncbi:MAG TPA: GNAT family N-acetyltransferase [Bauldia sp.]|nr:GNAT family N-acetyltransferase [Bauldia sp.]